MTKEQLTDYVVGSTTLTRSQAKDAVESVFEGISYALKNDDSVYLRGFATFKPMTTKSRKGRDIAKGETVIIPARKTVKLVLSNVLKNNLNE